MRIIAGRFRGKKLVESSSKIGDLRPTTDRSRESLFSILDSNSILKSKGFELTGSTMLDLCCGTGSVGFEALSRGIKKCVFVDIDKRHLDITKKNAELTGVEDEIEILNCDATNLPKFLSEFSFNLIFIDPPYKNDYSGIFKSLSEQNIFTTNCLIVVEYEKKMDLVFCEEGIEFLFKKEYGKSCFGFYSFN